MHMQLGLPDKKQNIHLHVNFRWMNKFLVQVNSKYCMRHTKKKKRKWKQTNNNNLLFIWSSSVTGAQFSFANWQPDMLEGLMPKLKLQFFGHLMQTADSLEKSLMLGKIEGRSRKAGQRMRWLGGIMMQWTWSWANFGRWWEAGRPSMLQPTGSQRVRQDWVTEQKNQPEIQRIMKDNSVW